MENLNIVAKTDFITHGLIQIIGEHVYITLQNRLTLASYAFHLPKSLFCLMIKKRKIEKDDPMGFKSNIEEKEEEIESESQSDPTNLNLEMFG